MKILTIDIETRPNLAYVWGLWDQNIGLNQLEEVGSVISWAAKWHGTKKIHFASDYHDGHETMLEKVWDLLDEADVVIGYNTKNFDIKHLNREFVLAGMSPPSPWVDIDLIHVVRQNFKFSSNRLQHVATELGLGGKVDNGGFDLWVACMKMDDIAPWNMMMKYNKQDVVLTEKLYDRLLPWIKNHPHRGLYGGDKLACPRCGSTDNISRGYYKTKTGRYRLAQCKDCGGYFKANRVEDASDRVQHSAV